MSSEPEQRPFGRTGERVSVIGLGGAALCKSSYELGVETVKLDLDEERDFANATIIQALSNSGNSS